MKGKKLPSYKYCFGCGRQNPIGLKLDIYWDEENHLVYAPIRLKKEYEGFENVIHGGIISTIVDELLWWCVAAEKRRVTVTAELKIRFKKPMQPEKDYTAFAKLVEERGRRFMARCEIKDENKIVAEGEGILIGMPEESWREFLDGVDDPNFFDRKD